MTAPERLSDTAPWGDWFERAMNSGAPNLDNVSGGEIDGPGICTCPVLPAGHTDDDCAAETWNRVAS